MLVYGGEKWYDEPFERRSADRYSGISRESVLADIERRIADIRIDAERGLVREQVRALWRDIYGADTTLPDDVRDATLNAVLELEREGKKGEARRYLESARTNSARIDVSHEIWKMESFLHDVVYMEVGESEEDWRLRAYPVLGITKEEIESLKTAGMANQAKTLLSVIRFLSGKGLRNLAYDEKSNLAAFLRGLEVSLSRVGKNFNSIGTSREELKPCRDAVKGERVHPSTLHSFAWVLDKYKEAFNR